MGWAGLLFSIFAANQIGLTIADAGTVRKTAPRQVLLAALPTITTAESLILAPLQKQEFVIGFKNTGKKSWKPTRSAPLSLRSDVGGESYFHHASWAAKNIVLKKIDVVPAGHVAYFKFILEAPKKESEYQERLLLFLGDVPLSGGTFTLPITVTRTIASAPKEAPLSATSSVQAPLPVQPPPSSIKAVLAAQNIIQGDPVLAIPSNGEGSFKVGFKNTGTVSFADAQTPVTFRSLAKRESYFYGPTWAGKTSVKRMTSGNPGELTFIDFTLHAPSKQGTYTEKLALFEGDRKLVGTEVDLSIVVGPPAPKVPTPPRGSLAVQPSNTLAVSPPPLPVVAPQQMSIATSTTETPFVPQGIVDDLRESEKKIRIGLFNTRDPIRMTANKEFEIRDTNGTFFGSFPSGTNASVTFDFVTRLYEVATPNGTSTTAVPVRFSAAQTQVASRGIVHAAADGSVASSTPDTTSTTPSAAHATTSPQIAPATPATSPTISDQDIVFEILSYVHRPGWSSAINDNTFRAVLEVRYAPATDKLWVINELFLEQYLKGLAETSNNSPYEYQKALLIAARTYALYHINRSTKYASEHFTIRATDADQVYRGYGAEQRLPNVSRAVSETRGAIVTYNGELAITPYYSQSDGRTRNWEEVWGGGPKPWLIGKNDPCCSGLKMLGHGVGMSARGALLMAIQGKGYEEILKYYYTAIELRRRYL